jgi:hypothetical protein
MSENTFKDELLKQNGKSAVDEEVSRLHRIIESEQRRFRRLVFWTVAVWAVWILMISVALVVPMVQARLNPPPVNSPSMPVSPPPVDHSTGGGRAALGMAMGVLLVGAFLGLPLAGVVLAVMVIVTRRTVSLNQVRASLAAIEAQLQMLGAPRTSDSGAVKERPPH